MLEPKYLGQIFRDVGLPPEQADRAAGIALRRLIRRQRPPKASTGLGFRGALTADPLVSVNRILGLGDGGLPFYDDLLARLSEVDFALVFGEAGLEPEVAIVRARAVAEANGPATIFLPVWKALGQHGPLNLDALRRLDWTRLRGSVDDGRPPLDPGPPPPPSRRKVGAPLGQAEPAKQPKTPKASGKKAAPAKKAPPAKKPPTKKATPAPAKKPGGAKKKSKKR